MQDMSKEIWKEILPPEREVLPAAKTKRPKDAPPQADHWPLAILLERAAYLPSWPNTGTARPARH